MKVRRLFVKLACLAAQLSSEQGMMALLHLKFEPKYL